MMNNMMGPDGKKNMNNKMKQCLVIMDSMTNDELDCVVDVAGNESRISRIARGSGCKDAQPVKVIKMKSYFSD